MARVSRGAIGKTALGLPLLGLTFAAWIVTLAGLAIARHDGSESGLGFLWFVWAFEGFVLFFCLLHLIEVGAGFSLAHAATASLLAVVTVLTILETETTNGLRKAGTGGNGSNYHKGIITLFAGFLILSVLNVLLLIVLGTKHEPGVSSHEKHRSQPQGVVTGTQGYGSAVPATGYEGGGTTTVV